MELILFVKGVLVGVLIAAPVGPVGLLCVQRSLQTGLRSGLSSGLGAAAADTLFGAFAAFGLALVADFFLTHQVVLRFAGGLLLLAIGVQTLVKPPREQVDPVPTHRFAADFASTFVLTITNPITILAFGPVFVAVEAVVPEDDLLLAWTLIAGVLLGSALWWLLLCTGASFFRARVSIQRLRWISKLSGGVILFFGVLVLASLTEMGRRLTGSADLPF